MGFATVVVDNVVDHCINPFVRLHRFICIDCFHLNIGNADFLFHSSDVLDREFEHVSVADGIGDDIFVQTLTKTNPLLSVSPRVRWHLRYQQI